MTATSEDPARQLRADARRNRERILEAAGEVFARDGVEAQVDDVARLAGVGVGTVYRHFPTKEALMAEIVRRKFREWIEQARAAVERDDEPFVVFGDLLRANAESCARDAIVLNALSGAAENVWEQADAEQEELLGLTELLLTRAQSAGTVRPAVLARDIPMLMCGLSASMLRSGPGFDWRRHLELLIELMRA